MLRKLFQLADGTDWIMWEGWLFCLSVLMKPSQGLEWKYSFEPRKLLIELAKHGQRVGASFEPRKVFGGKVAYDTYTPCI
jgi:hypothetical protein